MKLNWDKPKKVLSTDAWRESYGFEDGPHGGYVPNMSHEDAISWKAKITGTKLGYPQVEIRKSANEGQLLMIVNLGDGYNYKHYRVIPEEKYRSVPFFDLMGSSTAGKCVHMSLNGPATLSYEDSISLGEIVQEAMDALDKIVTTPGRRIFVGLYVENGFDSTLLPEAKIVVNLAEDFNIICATIPESLIPATKAVPGVKKVMLQDHIALAARSIFDQDYRLVGAKDKLAAAVHIIPEIQ